MKKTVTMPGLTVEVIGNDGVFRKLDELVGQQVAITWTSKPLAASHFDTAVTVRGVLEKNPREAGKWRVLVSEDSYAYISDPKHVMGIVPYSKGWRIFVG